MSAGRGATVIIGPRTRTGQALARRLADRDEDVLVVARHDDDTEALRGVGTAVLPIEQALDLLPAGTGPVRIAVCALGPIHPGPPRSDVDSTAFHRDLAFIERLLAAASDRPVSVVLISTVIALAPGPDRRYYGGWKCLAEQQLGETIGHHAAHASYSVVYPGRLMDAPSPGFLPALHMSHDRLAARVDELADGRSRSRIAGIDARLWMLARSARLLLSALRAHRGSPRGGSPEPLGSLTVRNSSP